MTDQLAVDMLSTTIDPAAIKAAGYVAVLRYLKNLTPEEAHGYLAHGLGIGTIFESAATESLGGAAAGAQDGAVAAAMMRSLGQPAGTVHVVNLSDFAPTPADLPAITAYWHAYTAQTRQWQVIPYATGWLLHATGFLGWQNAMDDEGVPGSRVSSRAVIYQRVAPTKRIAGSYDEDVILSDALRWWGITAPTPANPTPEEPVDLTPAQIQAIAVAVKAETQAEHPGKEWWQQTIQAAAEAAVEALLPKIADAVADRLGVPPAAADGTPAASA